jgi:hypothetical protein
MKFRILLFAVSASLALILTAAAQTTSSSASNDGNVANDQTVSSTALDDIEMARVLHSLLWSLSEPAQAAMNGNTEDVCPKGYVCCATKGNRAFCATHHDCYDIYAGVPVSQERCK